MTLPAIAQSPLRTSYVPSAPAGIQPIQAAAFLFDPRRERGIPLGERNMIGRAVSAAIPVFEPSVSRNHALVRQVEDVFELVPIRGVTLVNGERATTTSRLREGDEIVVGKTVLRFTTRLPHKVVSPGRTVGPADRAAAEAETSFLSVVELRERKRRALQKKVGRIFLGLLGLLVVLGIGSLV